MTSYIYEFESPPSSICPCLTEDSNNMSSTHAIKPFAPKKLQLDMLQQLWINHRFPMVNEWIEYYSRNANSEALSLILWDLEHIGVERFLHRYPIIPIETAEATAETEAEYKQKNINLRDVLATHRKVVSARKRSADVLIS